MEVEGRFSQRDRTLILLFDNIQHMTSRTTISRRTVLGALGGVAGGKSFVGTIVARRGGRGRDEHPGQGRGRGGGSGRPDRSTMATGGGVVIKLESCQVAEVRGSDRKVEDVIAKFEFYENEAGEGPPSWAYRAYDDLPVTIVASEDIGALPEPTGGVVLSEVEAVDENYDPIANVSTPDDWECEALL